MSNRMLVASKKGLFTLARKRTNWKIERADFLGVPVSMALADPRDGSLYAALDHGHFGVKLHASRDGGASWEEIAAPVFPPPVEGEAEWRDPMRNIVYPHSLKLIWALETGGPKEPGVL